MRSQWEDPVPGGVSFAMPRITPVVKALLFANIAVFVLEYVLFDGLYPRALEFVEHTFALDPAQWRAGFPPLWQLETYGYLHGGLSHLFMNMLFLYFLGTMLEEEVGSRRFALFYHVAVPLAGACQLALGLYLGEEAPIVGASGGLLAVVCAMATLRPGTRMIFIIVPMTLRTMALLYVALNVYAAIEELKGRSSGVANFAHLSGALCGYAAVKTGWIWSDPWAGLERWRERRAESRGVSDAERLDQLLVKIDREGIQSLSSRERAFLKRASQRR